MHYYEVTRKCRISATKARKELIITLGDAPAILFGFYLEKKSTPYYAYADMHVATQLGWAETKVTENRELLIEAGWFKQSIFSSKKGTEPMRMTELFPRYN